MCHIEEMGISNLHRINLNIMIIIIKANQPIFFSINWSGDSNHGLLGPQCTLMLVELSLR